MTKKPKENWKEEFDKLWIKNPLTSFTLGEKTKSFISKLLEVEREKMLGHAIGCDDFAGHTWRECPVKPQTVKDEIRTKTLEECIKVVERIQEREVREYGGADYQAGYFYSTKNTIEALHKLDK